MTPAELKRLEVYLSIALSTLRRRGRGDVAFAVARVRAAIPALAQLWEGLNAYHKAQTLDSVCAANTALRDLEAL